jgi:hypothetical protein
MDHLRTKRWLEAWGYASALEGLHRHQIELPASYAYRNELEELLNPKGIIRATAVYDVEGTPTVCFIEDDGQLAENTATLNLIREKIWNQNLISVILVMDEGEALAFPVIKRELEKEVLPWSKASETGPFSRRDVQSGEIFRSHTAWFSPEDRVDRVLLSNLHYIVKELVEYGLEKIDAQYLMAQVLFVSYLEHRDIIGGPYRAKHNLKSLGDLVRAGDSVGVIRLLTQLKHDLNGDFIEPETNGLAIWKSLSNSAFTRLKEFLDGVDLGTRQRSLWNYDFRFIPVELISGIYESFLSEERREVGAYYTSRQLANLVVDRALAESPDILAERIYDGACGSGILLTTVYRRILSYAASQKREPLRFEERRKLLEEHIFGSDLSVSACRVTAFSLYLSMLEGLQPADIAELQDSENVKLPSLSQNNIIGGPGKGDFFSDKNPHANSRRFTIFLSNPPWVEPRKDQELSSDRWSMKQNIHIPRRQTAGAFMLRVRESLAPDGLVCLILPLSIIAATTSAAFFKTWLDLYRVETLINFGDLRKLLFNTSKQPCVLALGRPRVETTIGQIPGTETFEYWVPKADVSFAFGRLTLHSSDRHVLQTRDVSQDNELLTSLFWGTARDVATITELRLLGRLGDLIDQRSAWQIGKGFHRHDAAIDDPVSADPLRELPFLDANRFVFDGPILNRELLIDFPHEIKSIPRLNNDLIAAFNAPKIVFPDGLTRNRRIRAAFSKDPFSFSNSIGFITGPKDDEPLLRFLAAYLQSSLAQYILLLTAYQITFERERVKLSDVRQLPFIHPDKHPEPMHAWRIVKSIMHETLVVEQSNEFLAQPYNPQKYDSLILEYFGLNRLQQARVYEVSQSIAPYLQPGSVLNLNTPLQRRPNHQQIDDYAKALYGEINSWSKFRGGVGDVTVGIIINSELTSGPLGIIKVDPAAKTRRSTYSIHRTITSDKGVHLLLERLSHEELLPMKIQGNLHLATDAVIRLGETIYLVKPLVARLWLQSEAYRDAERIVISVLSSNYDRE